MDLTSLGWNPYFEAQFSEFSGPDRLPARVVREERDRYLVAGADGEYPAVVAGRLRHQSQSAGEFPAVGDWVVIEKPEHDGTAVIQAVLPRRTAFTRKVPGVKSEEQVLAANVDLLFLVSGLDHDFNLRRIERYLTTAWDSGASPVILLNKADLRDDLDEVIEQVERIAVGVPIHVLSAARRTGLEVMWEYLGPGQTVVLLGSSGVGKSTLINCLIGYEKQRVQDVREDDSKGRHTTTHRELIVLEKGGVVIDTPGIRQLKLWTDEGAVRQSFSDIEELAENCRFRDCSHNGEPGCAIGEAIDNGSLDPGRFQSYLKLQREMRWQRRRSSEFEARQAQREFARRIKHHHKEMKRIRKAERPWDKS